MAREDRSVLTRGARPPDAVLRYGDHPDHVVDLRLPAGTAPAPLVVVLHGGFWRQGYDRAHAGPMSEALADAGYAVATAEYRRVGASGGGWPGTFDDVAAAVDVVPTLAAAAAPGRVLTGRMVLVGHSAGGHLALWAAARHRLPVTSAWHRRKPQHLAGVLALAPVADLVAAERDHLGDDAVRALLHGVPARDRPEADPARWLPLGVPTRVVHGVDDALVPPDQCHALRHHGAVVHLLPDTGHFAPIDPRSAAWPTVLAAVAALVAPRG